MDPHSQPGSGDPLTMPKRASTLLFVLGGLALLLGTCALVLVNIPRDQFHDMMQHQKLPAEFQNLPAGYSPEDMMMLKFKMLMAVGLVSGSALIFLAIFVRRANKAAMVFGVILCVLALLYLIVDTAGGVMQAAGNPLMLLGVCFMVIPLVLFGLAATWLMQALKALPRIEAARAQWQATYNNAQQQQQMYNQGSSGYGQGIPLQYYGTPPGAGAPPPGSSPPVGYGAMPTPPPAQNQGLPVRHPPLPPNPQDPGSNPPG